jgi:hypothetical protein
MKHGAAKHDVHISAVLSYMFNKRL